MGTLKIGDKSVTVGDDFFKLSPEQQHGTVDEIAKSLNVSAPEVKLDTDKLSQNKSGDWYGGASPLTDFIRDPIEIAKNAPGSFLKAGQGVLQAAVHPVETAKGLARIAGGGIEKARRYAGLDEAIGPHEKSFDAWWEDQKQAYGGIENIKNTIKTDPARFLGDLSMLAGGAGAGVRAAGMAGTAERLGQVSRVANPLYAPVKAVEKTVEHGGPLVAGLMTGKGVSPFKSAISEVSPGKAAEFRKEISAPDGKRIVDEFGAAVEKWRLAKSGEYQREIAKVKGRPDVFDFNDIWSNFRKTTDKFALGSQKIMTPEVSQVYKKLGGYLQQWQKLNPAEYHTAAGYDMLKKAIGDVADTNKDNPPGRKFAMELYDAVEGTITRLDPNYARIMKSYSEFKRLEHELKATLGVGNRNLTEDTALRKILSSTRSNVNTNFGRREKLVEELMKYNPNLKAMVAGHVLNPALPGGLAQLFAGGEAIHGLTNPSYLPALAASSPRLMGEALHGFGRFREFLRRNPSLAAKLMRASPQAVNVVRSTAPPQPSSEASQ